MDINESYKDLMDENKRVEYDQEQSDKEGYVSFTALQGKKILSYESIIG